MGFHLGADPRRLKRRRGAAEGDRREPGARRSLPGRNGTAHRCAQGSLRKSTPGDEARCNGARGPKNRSQNEIYNDYEPTAAFIDDTAKKTNKGRATVARDAKRGKEGKAWLGEIVGTSLDGKSEIDALINLSEDNRNELIEKARAGKKVSAKGQLKKQKRAEREAGLAGKIAALPEGKFGVVVEDFEWDHETWSEAGKDRHASNHYPTSRDAHTAEEIVERTKDRFAGCAADDCVLLHVDDCPRT